MLLPFLGAGCAEPPPPPSVDPTEPPVIATVDAPAPALADPRVAPADTGEGLVGETFNNPLASGTPDPHVSVHGDWVYLVYSIGDSLVLRRAASLVDLTDDAETQVIWTPPADTLHSADLWGPELHVVDGRAIVYYSATDVSFFGLSGEYRIWALEADGTDPWDATWTHRGPLVVPGQDAVAIHPHIFEAGGDRFVAWSGRREGLDFVNRIFVAELTDAFTVVGPAAELAAPIEAWEGNALEAPAVVERDGRRALVFTGNNCLAAERGLGGLVQDASASPTDAAAWTASPVPWFESDEFEGVYQVGSPGFVTSPDGTEDWLVYHGTTASFLGCGDDRSLHLNRVTWTPDGPVFDGPTGVATSLPVPGGTP